MNKPNNKRKRESIEKIEKIFIELIQSKKIEEISVTDICNKANLNRSTFYANFIDIYDLAEHIRIGLEQEVANLYTDEQKEKKDSYNSYNFLKLFNHIKENQLFYKTYFKLNFDNKTNISDISFNYEQALKYYYDTKHINYHIEFFKAGLNAIIKKWLENNCKESPEEILEIIKQEYKKH